VPSSLFRRKNIDKLISDCEGAELRLKKSLGWLSLTSLGIGAVIGSGIFTIVGTAIAGQKFQASSILNAPLLEYLVHHSASFGRPGAGPAIALSFVLVAIVCGFASVCYAELAAMIPIAGSAYTYTYATMGEIIAWIIGWDLILEYAVSNMAVSVGFSQHIVNLLDWFGLHPDPRWISPAYLPSGLSDLQGNMIYGPGWHFGFNWPAFIIVMILTMILVRGIRESASTNNIMVLIKIIAILAFVTFAARLIHPANWHPFAPNGWPGILTGGSIVFFTYIGFDSVSTAAEECTNAQRDLPRGIIATLVVCTLLYIAVVVVLTGLVRWDTLLDDAAPVVNTLKKFNVSTLRLVVLIGALMGMISSLLVFKLARRAFGLLCLAMDFFQRFSAASTGGISLRIFPPGSRVLSWEFQQAFSILAPSPTSPTSALFSPSRSSLPVSSSFVTASRIALALSGLPADRSRRFLPSSPACS